MKRLTKCSAWLFLTWSSAAFAQAPAVPVKVINAPSAIPDRIILTITADPTTSQAVTWRTSKDVEKGIAQIAVAGPNKDFAKSANEVPADSADLDSDLGPARYHTAVFTGLAPKTKYAYRVGDGANWSEWIHLVTASKEAEPFSFIYFGDAQTEVHRFWSRVIRESFTDAPKARFLLHAGDLINHAQNDAEWGEWHRAAGWLNSMIPVVATPGNHEYALISKPAPPAYRLSDHWRPQFAFPTNGPPGLEETVYFFDYQGVRVVSLNSNQDILKQVNWLDTTLTDNPSRWTIVTFHHPIFSSTKGRDNPVIRKNWQPIFDKYHVDLVLQGHDHTYARTGLETMENVPTGVASRAGAMGTVYVVSVSGPKMYRIDRNPRMRRAAGNTQLYQIITVDGMSLRYEARTAVGEVYDAFTLKKHENAPNELIEQVPNTPERLQVDDE